MKKLVLGRVIAGTAGMLLGLTAPAAAQSPVGPASAKVVQRVEHLLQPGPVKVGIDANGPTIWNGPRKAAGAQLVATPYQGLPPQPPLAPPRRPVAPHAAPEGPPAVAQGVLPPVPHVIELPTQPLVTLPAVDVESPLPLPTLARPQGDRAPLQDTTMAASLAAAMHRINPRRVQPVPFVPLNLPDPFENVHAGELRDPPPESNQPPAAPVRTPRP